MFPCLLWLADDTVSSKCSCLCSAIFLIIFYILFFEVVSILCVSWHCAFICLNLLCYQRYTGRYHHSRLHSLLLSGCADALVFHKNLFFCTFPLIRHKYFHESWRQWCNILLMHKFINWKLSLYQIDNFSVFLVTTKRACSAPGRDVSN